MDRAYYAKRWESRYLTFERINETETLTERVRKELLNSLMRWPAPLGLFAALISAAPKMEEIEQGRSVL